MSDQFLIRITQVGVACFGDEEYVGEFHEKLVSNDDVKAIISDLRAEFLKKFDELKLEILSHLSLNNHNTYL